MKVHTYIASFTLACLATKKEEQHHIGVSAFDPVSAWMAIQPDLQALTHQFDAEEQTHFWHNLTFSKKIPIPSV